MRDLNLKCFFGFHLYKLTHKSLERLFISSDDKYPYMLITRFLWRCKRCSKIKTKKVQGDFVTNSNDKDDDRGDEDSHSDPIIPDDYFDKIQSTYKGL